VISMELPGVGRGTASGRDDRFDSDVGEALAVPLADCWDLVTDLAAGALVGSGPHEGDLIRLCRVVGDLRARLAMLEQASRVGGSVHPDVRLVHIGSAALPRMSAWPPA